jgi:putative membrane-bound dehydrogenase-like protein
MPWRHGVLVSAAPEIFFAADTDGDGKADVRETLYRGFGEGNQQHRVNGFAWGLDNWIYLANGDSGGRIESLKTGKTIDISGRDLRIRPDTGDLDPQTGQTQFGRRRDDWGNWFSCTNSIPIRHVAIADHYLRRNPHYAPPAPLRVLAHTRNTRLHPISRILSHWAGYRPPRGNEPHFFTSASGTCIYRDNLFGPRFVDNVFTCEPVHNMIHRQVLEADGTSFSSHRAPDEAAVEFLASSDSWFRPTTVRTGPDGALWIADMYRLVIEHTAYIDDRREETLDLRAGDDRGRIYRIVPIGKPARKTKRLDRRDAPQLAAALDSPNGWQRDIAQRLLIQTDHAQATKHVSLRLAEKFPALTRLHAMCTLDGLGTITTQQILAALDDSHAGVRRNAIRIAESRMSDAPAIMSKLFEMSGDDDPQVILQLAYTLGESRDVRAGKALGQLLVDHQTDPYLVAAILSSLTQQNITAAVNVVLSADGGEGERVDELLTQLLEIATAYKRPDALLHAFRNAIKREDMQTAELQRLTRLVQVAKQHKLELATSLDATSTERLRKLVAKLEVLVSDPGVDRDFRLAAVGLLGWTPSDDVDKRNEALITLLDPQNDPTLQQAAVAALGGATATQVATRLLTRWRRLSPAIRADVLELLLTRKTWTAVIVRQLERGRLTAGDLSPSHQQRLVLHDDVAIREKAKAVLNSVTPTDRLKLIQSYRDVLNLDGDKDRGRVLFKTHCSACHKVHTVGHAVGPDLLALKNRSAEAILVAVLDPNRSIEDKYRSYTVHTVEGRSLAGVLASESSNSLTLKIKDGKQQVILRRDIEELVSSGVSLMPEGMEKVLPQRPMADLLAYVTDLGPPPKTFSGNKPRVIKAAEDGALKLPVSASRIYGSTVVFEPRYGNLGFWQSEDDRADWSIQVHKSGEYEVLLDYACHNSTANNPFILHVGSQKIVGKVVGTGTWDDYRESVIGRIQLEAGSQQAVFRSQGQIDNCLIDLRAVVIRPLEKN